MSNICRQTERQKYVRRICVLNHELIPERHVRFRHNSASFVRFRHHEESRINSKMASVLLDEICHLDIEKCEFLIKLELFSLRYICIILVGIRIN